ncbi:MAG: sarcosine oxidase subunit delta [Rhodobacteraceae bacterium]|nr:sarcosine oxidase subunit delta [Paracoccaceae bacterium]
MRITCPLCGSRDRREFHYYGGAVYAERPAADAPPEAWDGYLHLRDNPAGETRDLWYHELGCSAWIEVTRNTVTHAVLSARLLAGPERQGRSARSILTKKKPNSGGKGR